VTISRRLATHDSVKVAINEFELDTGKSSGYGTEFNLQVGIEAQTVTGGPLLGDRARFAP